MRDDALGQLLAPAVYGRYDKSAARALDGLETVPTAIRGVMKAGGGCHPQDSERQRHRNQER